MMFVPTEPIPVVDEDGNVIYIRPKMGRGIEAQVSAEFVRMGGRSQQAYDMCLLYYNVIKWEGPAFETTDKKGRKITVPCNRQNLELLDPYAPLVQKAVGLIAELNKRPSLDEDGNPTTATPTQGM